MKRSYKQNCALAHALDMVGERWTLLLVRELLIGPRRYGELLESLAGIGTNLLADRLRQMTSQELITRDQGRYRLTQKGRQLEPVVASLVRFGLSLDGAAKPEYLSRPEWDAVALRALLPPGRDVGLVGKYQLDLDGQPFTVAGDGGVPAITHGACASPRARVALDKETARALVRGEQDLGRALYTGRVQVLGPETQARRLLQVFGIT